MLSLSMPHITIIDATIDYAACAVRAAAATVRALPHTPMMPPLCAADAYKIAAADCFRRLLPPLF